MIREHRLDDSHVNAQRNELRAEPRHQFVDRESFCGLLISSRKLQRRDFSKARVRGLCDLLTGQTFMIEEEELLSSAAPKATKRFSNTA